MEDGAYTGLTFGQNVAMVVLCYFLANSETNAGTFIFIFAMKPLKKVEYAVFITLVEPYPVVGNAEPAKRPLPILILNDFVCYTHNGPPVGTAVFNAVADEVLQ